MKTIATLLATILFSSTTFGITMAWADSHIAGSAKSTMPLQKGTKIPNVSISDSSGNLVKLNSFLKDGPVVLVFFEAAGALSVHVISVS